MLVLSFLHERTLKNLLFQKKTVLRENNVNIESKSRSSQFNYTYIMKIHLLSVVTPPSIYQLSLLYHPTWINEYK